MNTFTVKGTARSVDVTLEQLTTHEEPIRAWIGGRDVDQGGMTGEWEKYKGMAAPHFSLSMPYRVHQPRAPKIGEVWEVNSTVCLYSKTIATYPNRYVSFDGRNTYQESWTGKFLANSIEEYFGLL